VLRLHLQDDKLNKKIDSFTFNKHRITNLEMETSAIYGLSKLLGHKACSISAIMANRAKGTFSKDPDKLMANLILYTLDKLVE
jgi:uridine phosphorylase